MIFLMLTITTRQLKQNPAAAVRQVLDAGQPVAVTAHGQPTGVMLAPEGSGRRTWVSGAAIARSVAPLGAAQVQAWQDDLAAGRDADFVSDPWARRP